MTVPRFATLLLRLDAAANALLALALLVATAPVASALGLGGRWPLVALALGLVVNGALCWQAARTGWPAPAALRRLAVPDLVFAVAVIALAVTDPTGAVPWMRWTLAGLGDVVLLVGAAKLVLAIRLATAADRVAST